MSLEIINLLITVFFGIAGIYATIRSRSRRP